MATVANLQLTITRNVANAICTGTWDIIWDQFDQLTNLDYTESFKLIEDDTFQDGDNLPVGDDAVPGPILIPIFGVSSNGNASTARTQTRTIAFADLDHDVGDDEIRGVVTLTPRLPVTTSRESAAVVVVAP